MEVNFHFEQIGTVATTLVLEYATKCAAFHGEMGAGKTT